MEISKKEKTIRKRFKFLNIDKVIFYKNPNECNKLMLERINPNHIGLIWGKRKKKLNKGDNPIKIGKVFFHSLPVMVGSTTLAYIDSMFNYAYNLVLQVGVFTISICLITAILYYATCFKVFDKACLTT
jgi:hypothetical protein